MPKIVNPPLIDTRNIEDVAKRLRKLIIHNTNAWDNVEALTNDKQANAFVYTFANMMQVMLERLNKLPEKNHIAFLNMLGIQPKPAQASRVPVAFDLTKKSPRRIIVIPKHTQVATDKTADNKPLIFETEQEFAIIRPDLEKAVCIDGLKDRWANVLDDIFNVIMSKSTALFKGNELVPHRLYLGDKLALGFESPTELIVQIELEEENADICFKGDVKWYCHVEDVNSPIPLNIEKAADKLEKLKYKRTDIDRDIVNCTKNGFIKFEDIYYKIFKKELSGFGVGTEEDYEDNQESREDTDKKKWTNHFIFAELDNSIAKLRSGKGGTYQRMNMSFPKIKNITLITKPIQAGNEVGPEILIFNNSVIDFSKAFYPFGERPKFNDTFYIGSKEIFSKKGSTITLTFKKPQTLENPQTTGITIYWEFFDGFGWQHLGMSSDEDLSTRSDTGNDTHNFSDETRAFTWRANAAGDEDGEISFTCPSIAKTKINAKENRFLRARIVKGDYDIEKSVKINDKTSYKVLEPFPPVIDSLQMGSQSLPTKKTPEQILTYNNFYYRDISNASGREGGGHAANLLKKPKTLTPFIPFEASGDQTTTLYFSFKEDVSDLPVNLFFSLANTDDEALSLIAAKDSIGVTVEYWNNESWQPISFTDYTDNLTKQGAVFFYVPKDIQSRVLFEKKSYWLRIRYQKGDSKYLPKIDGLYINTDIFIPEN